MSILPRPLPTAFTSGPTISSDSLDSTSDSILGTNVGQVSAATPKRLRSMKIRDPPVHAGRGTEHDHQSLVGSDLKPSAHSAFAPADAAIYDTTSHQGQNYDGHHDYYDAFDEMATSARPPHMSASVPQLPPVPVSPISPRWDSLFHGNLPLKYDSSSVSDRSISLESNPRIPVGGEGQPLAFPGLSSHAVSSDHGSAPSSPSVPHFSLPDLNAGSYYRPLTPSSSTTKSFVDNSPSRDGTPTIGNFSRPRKPSIRQGGVELVVPRQRTGTLPEGTLSEDDEFITTQPLSNPLINPAIQGNDPDRGRGYSMSSAQSITSHPSLPQRPSNDQLGVSSRTTSVRRGTASSNMTKPSLGYNENNTATTVREPPPWVSAGSEELRSSFRSQLTASTALGTVFTVNGTERSSVLTKASSITGSLIIDGYARASIAEDDGLSVEDVMGMYEQGFHDDSDEEDGRDADRDGSEAGDDDQRIIEPGQPQADQDVVAPQPRTGASRTGRLVDQLLDAMSEPLPIPGVSVARSREPVIARDSGAFFRNSGLPSSLPRDVTFGPDSDTFGVRTVSSVDDMSSSTTPRQAFLGAAVQAQQETLQNQDRLSPNGTQDPSDSIRTAPGNIGGGASARAPTPSSVSALPQEPEEDPTSRDRYGFRKANQYITREQYDSWDASYSEYLARRRKKWIAYLKDNSLMTDHPDRFPQRNAKTKRFVRKGIPPDWRGAAWFYYAGGPKIMAKHPGVYDEMVRGAGLELSGAGKSVPERCGLKPIIVEDIEKDLHRTFPDNVRFRPPRTTNLRAQAGSPVGTEDSEATLTNEEGESSSPATEAEPEIISSLRRVLHAFALYNPRIGYCQSLNFLAGLLLLFVESEEHAFWLLNVITRVYLPGTHEMSLEGSKVDLGVLMTTLKDALPSVWKQIGGDESEMASSAPKKSKGKRFREISNPSSKSAPADPNRLPAITLCMTAWFMSCFIGTLPIETVLRVWDVFFYEGSRTLFRIALTIFKTGEAEIKAVADPMEMFGVVQALPRRMLDPNPLLEACYRKRHNFKHLSQELVEEKRQEHRDAIQKWKTTHETGNDRAGPTTKDGLSRPAAAGLDLAADMTDPEAIEVRRKGTIFGKRKVVDKEQARAEDVL